ncbi:MAG: F-type H+-transporting ATPase subunit gamma [Cognaticolwellia sp.]
MANLRDIKRRIGSVKNTRQITKAMKMVSGAKLKRAQNRAEGAQPYAKSLDRVLKQVLASAGEDVSHPLLTSHEKVETVRVILMGSDKGLCGSFNGGLNRKTAVWLRETFLEKNIAVQLYTYGKKTVVVYKTHKSFVSSKINVLPEHFAQESSDLAATLGPDFESGEVQEVYVAYNAFESVMIQEPTFLRLLPMAVDPTEEGSVTTSSDDAAEIEYKYEPNGEQLLNTLLPLQLQTLLLQAFLDSAAGEQAARMTAMDSATRNASDLVDRLTLEYNRARQAAITTEIIEIVSGAEAL